MNEELNEALEAYRDQNLRKVGIVIQEIHDSETDDERSKLLIKLNKLMDSFKATSRGIIKLLKQAGKTYGIDADYIEYQFRKIVSLERLLEDTPTSIIKAVTYDLLMSASNIRFRIQCILK